MAMMADEDEALGSDFAKVAETRAPKEELAADREDTCTRIGPEIQASRTSSEKRHVIVPAASRAGHDHRPVDRDVLKQQSNP